MISGRDVPSRTTRASAAFMDSIASDSQTILVIFCVFFGVGCRTESSRGFFVPVYCETTGNERWNWADRCVWSPNHVCWFWVWVHVRFDRCRESPRQDRHASRGLMLLSVSGSLKSDYVVGSWGQWLASSRRLHHRTGVGKQFASCALDHSSECTFFCVNSLVVPYLLI